MRYLFESMLRCNLVSTGSGWLERAVQQKNTRITIELACTVLDRKMLRPDHIDKLVLSCERVN